MEEDKKLVSESGLPAANLTQVETAQHAGDVSEEPTQEFERPTAPEIDNIEADSDQTTPPIEQPQTAVEPQKKGFFNKLFNK